MIAVLTILLLIAVIALAVLLVDTRARLQRLERRLEDGTPPVEAPHRRPAVIIRDVPAPSVWEAAPEPVAPTVAAPVAVVEQQAPSLPPEPAHPEPAPEPTPELSRLTLGLRFEDLFGRRLPIWAGGITLAVAGVLLVKYSIDAGLLSPMVRIWLGLVFGTALIAGAETARRAEAKVGDPRVAQALSGAGIASLYAAILAASDLYHLIGPVLAFVGLAAVTAMAMALSIRFGAPSALLGLVGGLAAPALVGEGPPDVPLLSAYLALAIGGLTALSRRQRWMWLSVSALIGGAGWGAVLVLTSAVDDPNSLSLGLLVLLIGVGLPMLALMGEARATIVRGIAAVVAAAQIALLVARGGFEPLQWGLYLLLAAALGWLAWRDAKLRPLPPVGLAIGLLLTILWPDPPAGRFAVVMLLIVAIHAAPAWARLWRGSSEGMIEAGQIAASAVLGHAIAWVRFEDAGQSLLAALAFGAAVLPGAAAAQGWAKPERLGDGRFALLAVASALLLAGGAYLALPFWMLPIGIAVATAGLAMLAHAAGDRRVAQGAVAFLIGTVGALVASDSLLAETSRLAGETAPTSIAQAVLRWTVVAVASGIVAWRGAGRTRAAVEALAAILVYGALAQIAPGWILPIVAALGLFAAAEAGRRVEAFRPLAPALAFGVVVLCWAIRPLSDWLGPALLSIPGEPLFVGALPTLSDALTRLVVPVALVAAALWRVRASDARLVRVACWVTGVIGVVALHSLYKHLFAIHDHASLTSRGLAERTVWEALLLGLGYAAWRWLRVSRIAALLAGAALLHGLWFSLALFDPLLTEVAVGPLPVVNLLIPAFAVLFASLWFLERTIPRPFVTRAAHVLRMNLIVLFATMTLRQLFAGSLLVGPPVGSVENIGRSVLAIALAIGFLVRGIRTGRHDWRIGSLVLMLAAVAKVFLLDAAGLEGLLRIASFLALGSSLIGIGWLYSRFLRREAV